MGAEKFFVIDSFDGLALLGPYAKRDKHRIDRIELALPGIADAEQRSHEDRLNRHFFACGCAEGTALALIALVGTAAWLGLRDAPLGWGAIGVVLAAFVGGMGLGKWIGLKRAESRLATEVAAIKAKGPKPEPRSDAARCARH